MVSTSRNNRHARNATDPVADAAAIDKVSRAPRLRSPKAGRPSRNVRDDRDDRIDRDMVPDEPAAVYRLEFDSATSITESNQYECHSRALPAAVWDGGGSYRSGPAAAAAAASSELGSPGSSVQDTGPRGWAEDDDGSRFATQPAPAIFNTGVVELRGMDEIDGSDLQASSDRRHTCQHADQYTASQAPLDSNKNNQPPPSKPDRPDVRVVMFVDLMMLSDG